MAAAAAAALVGVLGAQLFNRTTGVLAGILVATNAEVVTLSQQARTYALAELAAVLVSILFLRAMAVQTWRPWLVYGVAGAVGVYTHFFIGFVLASHAVMFPRLSKTQRRHLLKAWVIVAIAIAPTLPFVAKGGRGGVDWIPPTSWHSLRLAVTTFSGFNVLIIIAAAIGAAAILSGRTPGAARWKGEAPDRLGYCTPRRRNLRSVFKPVLIGRYLVVGAPGLALLGAAALTAIRPRLIAAGVATAILAVSGVQIADWYDRVVQDWRGAARFAAAEEHKGATLALYPTGSYVPYQLYAPLPAACTHIPGHHEPRCDFRASGQATVVLTTEPDNWRRLPGSRQFRVVGDKRFGDDLWAFLLQRK